jgi:hypothetical protein
MTSASRYSLETTAEGSARTGAAAFTCGNAIPIRIRRIYLAPASRWLGHRPSREHELPASPRRTLTKRQNRRSGGEVLDLDHGLGGNLKLFYDSHSGVGYRYAFWRKSGGSGKQSNIGARSSWGRALFWRDFRKQVNLPKPPGGNTIWLCGCTSLPRMFFEM